MKKWTPFLHSCAKSDLWGLVILDYYHRKKDEGRAESPARFLRVVLPKIVSRETDVVAFHRVLVCVSIQLLGNDFTEVFSLSLFFLRSKHRSLSPAEFDEICNHFAEYGKEEAFRTYSLTRGLVTANKTSPKKGTRGGARRQPRVRESPKHQSHSANSVASENAVGEMAGESEQLRTQAMDFGIVVALKVEISALLSQFRQEAAFRKEARGNRTYYRSDLQTSQGQYAVVATMLPRAGNIDSALAANDMIAIWHPRNLLVLGIAAGIDEANQRIGDIVIGESIWYYELAKLKADSSEIRPRVLACDTLLYDRAMHLREDNWPLSIPSDLFPRKTKSRQIPTVHFGPIACGEKVIADIEAVRTLRRIHPKLAAIEMESAGAASAAVSAAQRTGFLAIRGISDFANSLKNDRWHRLAATSSAAWTLAFLKSGPVEPLGSAEPQIESPNQRPSLVTQPERRLPTNESVQLFQAIRQRVDLDELKTLCFYLGIDVDNLSGDRKDSKVRELIKKFDRLGKLDKLAEIFSKFSQEV